MAADLRALDHAGLQGEGCLTALTVQSAVRLRGTMPITPEHLRMQIAALVDDGGAPAAIKTGAFAGSRQVLLLARLLKTRLAGVPVVCDPVLGPTRGPAFVGRRDAAPFRRALIERLLPLVTVLTPNLDEYAWLFGTKSPEAASAASPAAILVKGGHGSGTRVTDRLYLKGKLVLEHSRRRVPQRIRGTGCVLASLIAARLAAGDAIPKAVQNAERMMDGAIRSARPAPGGQVSMLLLP